MRHLFSLHPQLSQANLLEDRAIDIPFLTVNKRLCKKLSEES
jgi:hypothetical protein